MNYISLCLFGQEEKYRAGLFDCIRSAQLHYPEWQIIIYCDRPNYEYLIGRNPPNTRIVLQQESSQGVEGANWRFLAVNLSDAKIVIFRDTDSLFTARERRAVDEWLASPFDVHLIRDHPYHTSLIMAGMFGVRRKGLTCLRNLLRSEIGSVRLTDYGDDQMFLNTKFYPKIRRRAMIHTTSIRFLLEYTLPLPQENEGEDFIGAYAYVTEEERLEYMRIKRSTPPQTLAPEHWRHDIILKYIYAQYPKQGIRYGSRWKR